MNLIGPFLVGHNVEFQYFGEFQKNEYFWVQTIFLRGREGGGGGQH